MMYRTSILVKKYQPGTKINEYTIINKLSETKNRISFLMEALHHKYVLAIILEGNQKRKKEEDDSGLDLLAALDHTGIPKWIDRIDLDGINGYVLEYIEGKTLEQIISQDKYQFKQNEIYDICQMLLDILIYLHRQNIVHSDINISNVILKNNELHLLNFERAHYIDDSKFKVEDDFSCLGELLLQLYYSSYKKKRFHRKPWGKQWYNELDVNERELRFLRRLKGLDERYRSAKEIQKDFSALLKQ